MDNPIYNNTRLDHWSADSWRHFPCLQNVIYPDQPLLLSILQELYLKDPLVSFKGIMALREHFENAANKKVFLLQAGDCAETFASCEENHVLKRISFLKEISQHLQALLGKPVIAVGRIAGQYAKPRSEPLECVSLQTDLPQKYRWIPVYRGDLINSSTPSPAQRIPDPSRLLAAYHCAQKTLQWITAAEEKGQTVFTSHEALHLPYESALTRLGPTGGFYNSSAHLLWLGERTNSPWHAHVEYLRGIENPIAIKISARIPLSHLILGIKKLNPKNTPGKIKLITRLGAQFKEDYLMSLIQLINQEKLSVIWSCDPMHGNTKKTTCGLKTRNFSDILEEVNRVHTIHKTLGTHLSGLHLELSADPLTECLDPQGGIREENLQENYTSACDPRLNREQTFRLLNNINFF